MHRFKIILLIFVSSILIASCNDSPTATENVTKEGKLVYKVDRYDNSPAYDTEVQVTYRNLNNKMVVDTVQIPWEKEFTYTYSTSQGKLQEFNANLLVQYNGQNVVFLKGRINAETYKNGSGFGKSFTINIDNKFKFTPSE